MSVLLCNAYVCHAINRMQLTYLLTMKFRDISLLVLHFISFFTARRYTSAVHMLRSMHVYNSDKPVF